MTNIGENLFTRIWNRTVARRSRPVFQGGLDLGFRVVDGQITPQRVTIPQGKRPEHQAVLGKTGSGKSYLLRHFASQDVASDGGFVYFDLHGDTTPYLLRLIAREEQRRRRDLSEKLIVIEPADEEFSVGLNLFERNNGQGSFLQISEFAQILRQRWQLESLGARTEELLRNAMLVLADNNLTLLELAPLLTDSAFRASCLEKVDNSEIRAYFQSRYDATSAAMQAVYRDPILNKVSAFTSNPRFRHMLGQQRSTFSLPEAIDQGRWVVLNLNKGVLGEQALTLGSLFLTKLKNALFARRLRSLFTFYLDEVQNLVSYDSGVDTLLSEARKFGISIVSANQFLDQYPPPIRSAILALGSHFFFQLSSIDAHRIALALDGGRSLTHLLKNLPPRQMIVKSGHYRWQQVRVPDVDNLAVDSSDLYRRCRARWARRREDVEQEIQRRHARFARASNEVLHDWD